MTTTDATRMPEKMSRDRDALDALLDSEIVGNVAYVHDDGTPGVLPTAVARLGDELIVHGSTGSRWMRLVSGAPAAVSVTAVGGIVVARSAFESSLIYSSAVLFGAFRVLEGDEKSAALDAITAKLIPGRLAEVRSNSKKELAATLVLALPIAEWSLRTSDDWPDDTDDDIAGDAWAGRCGLGRELWRLLPLPTCAPASAYLNRFGRLSSGCRAAADAAILPTCTRFDTLNE